MARKPAPKKTLKEEGEIDPETMAARNAASVQTKPVPESKSEAMAMAMNLMAGMGPEAALNAYDLMVQQAGYDAQEIDPNLAAQNAASIQMKPSYAAAVQESVNQAVADLFTEGETITEDVFKSKVATLFEAQVMAAVALQKEVIREEVEKELEGSFKAQMDQIVEAVDAYISHVADEWKKDNEVAIVSTLQQEATQEFMEGMRQLFAEHYLEIPEDRVDVVESLVQNVESLKEALNQSEADKIALIEANRAYYKQEVIAEAAKSLTLENQLKLKTLCEDFSADESLADKVKVVMESHFGAPVLKKPAKSNILTEGGPVVAEEPKKIPSSMAAYLNASKALKR